MEIALIPLVFYVLNLRIKHLREAIESKQNLVFEFIYLVCIVTLILGLFYYIQLIKQN